MDRFPAPYTHAAAVMWVQSHLEQHPMINFALAVNDEVVGCVGLEARQDVYRKTALIGYWLSEQYWGKGIMSEAVKLVTDYAFANLDFIRLQAGVISNNPASMHVLEKAGYQKEGIFRNAIIKNEVIFDEHSYAIIKM
jgi:RimJ/RimL family protein N-acetyltransferase